MGINDQQKAVAPGGLFGVTVDHVGRYKKYTSCRNVVCSVVENGVVRALQHEDDFQLFVEVGMAVMLGMMTQLDLLM